MDVLENAFRLSPQQAQVWLHTHLYGEAAFRIRAAVRIQGPFDRELLEKTLRFLVDKYEVLRTALHHEQDLFLPLQTIEDEPAFQLQDGPPPAQTGMIEGFAFYLHQDEDGALLTIDAPVLLMDRSGMNSLVAEIAHIYSLGGEEEPPENEEDEPLQYVDLAEWMHELLESDETEAGRNFWAEAGVSPEMNQQEAVQPFQPRTRVCHVDPETAARLEACAQSGLTLEDIVLSAWLSVLSKSGMNAPLTVASLLDGRKHEDIVNTPGLFARAVPIRYEIEAGQTFGQFARGVARAREDASKWQEFFSWSHLGHENLENPAFSSLFFDVIKPTQIFGEQVRFSLQPLPMYLEKFDLGLRLDLSGDCFELHLCFDEGALDEHEVGRMGERLLVALAGVAHDPDCSLQNVPVMSEAELALVLKTGRREPVAYQEDLCFHEHVLAHAARTPEKTALIAPGETYTYARLTQLAGQLAGKLMDQGVRVDDRVVVFMDRSPELVVAMLAILQAGAVFAPIDPDFPKTRVTYTIDDLDPALILTRPVYREKLSCQQPVLELEEGLAGLESQPRQPHQTRVTAQNLAYIIYTSGTTGNPKGVCISHRALNNYLGGVMKRLDLREDDVLTTFATVAADLGNTSFFGALFGGMTYRILPESLRLDADGLAEILGQEPVDFLKIVPSHLKMLLETDHPQNLLPRHCLALGGEKFEQALAYRIQELAPQLRLINHYGPTEATIGITTNEPKPPYDQEGAVPIGVPLDNSLAYIVDAALNPVVYGASGELVLGGDSLAQGYWRRPGLTAAKFIPDPFSNIPGARFYRSGDLARFNTSGLIDLADRLDNQIKIRGFRVELGEIEATLTRHPQIREAVVVVEKDADGAASLTAHLVLGEDSTLTHPLLSQWLGEQLPHFMHPGHFSVLKAIPINANGKIDRKALPLAKDAETLKREFVAPGNQTETVLCRIWSELLQIENLSVFDNFLDMGAHSFLVIRANKQIREELGRSISIVDLYKYPNVRALSGFLEGGEDQSLDSASVQDRAKRKRMAMNANRSRPKR